MAATTLVLMGRTGNGKSSTGNSILGRNAFKPGLSFQSTTQECQLEKTTLKDGRVLNVIDTPGLFDTNSTNSKEFLQSQIVKCIDLAKDGVHGVLYVVSVKNRFTAEEACVLDSLQMLFGNDIVNYMAVVFTGGDQLENDGLTLQAYLKDCPPQLQDVLRRCNMRTILFNNINTSQPKKEEQRNELIKQIDNIIEQNGGKPYSNDLLRRAQENSEKFLSRQTRNAHSGKASAEEEMERINAEHIKQLNAMVQEKMQTTMKQLQEKLAHEQHERKELEELVEEEIKLSKEIKKTRQGSCKGSHKECNKECKNYATITLKVPKMRCQFL